MELSYYYSGREIKFAKLNYPFRVVIALIKDLPSNVVSVSEVALPTDLIKSSSHLILIVTNTEIFFCSVSRQTGNQDREVLKIQREFIEDRIATDNYICSSVKQL